MDREALIQRLMATFLGELEEHVRVFERELIALEKVSAAQERSPILTTLFRVAHSLKGAARAVDAEPIEAACHELESVLELARTHGGFLSPKTLQTFFAFSDALADAERRLRNQQPLDDSPIAQLLPELQRLSRSCSRNVSEKLEESNARGASRSVSPRIIARAQAVDRPVEPPQPTPPRDEPPAAAASRIVSTPQRGVSLSPEKLDRLIGRGGELLVARGRMTGSSELAEELCSLAKEWSNRWHDDAEGLRRELRRNGNGHGVPNTRSLRVLEETGEYFKKLERDLDRLTTMIDNEHHLVDNAATPLEQDLRALRLIPFSRACEGLDRVVRDVARSSGKLVHLSIEDGEVELDRALIEGLNSSLIQLVRNAINHGIETPQERRELRKPEVGRITIRAALRGSRVEITVSDDGRGIDEHSVREQAIARGLTPPENEADVFRIILLPGFSTASNVTDTAGRGVGLEVVKSSVDAMHGAIDLTSAPRAGTTFRISVPLTLSSIRVVLLRCRGEVLALETASVSRFVSLPANEVMRVDGRDIVFIDGTILSLVDLGAVLGFGRGDEKRTHLAIAILTALDKRVALVVDEFVGEQEVVVKSLGARVVRLQKVSAATILSSGRVALILNVPEIVNAALRVGALPTLQRKEPAAPMRKFRILVVDDSVTTRTLEKTILEASGYEVITAADGREAWTLISHEEPDLVISDVEMPAMDGIALVEAIRSSPRFRELPVVLLTGRESEADRARGMTAGADAYLVKSAFERGGLLNVIAQFL